jgi:transcriptional regulator with XRE-family HTH domain
VSFTREDFRRTRLERGLSQQALADELNVARQTVVRWENGESDPSDLVMVHIERWLAGTNGKRKAR